ncbi:MULTISPECIES: dihydropteroate synthase [Paenibacillus]|uniref:Dihydropteroate synthase n=2 Tax=Paenibacillus aceti TaxID=1820010 RepID=A0ABQ1WB30_9BACL|nr:MULTISPECIES: dihydropteroate synthase [Paenibacillus]GGG20239.1 hypothetical protein GCM10010913_48040 [Paenibacillus aceti]
MGILNLTPDSFSDGGAYYNVDLALERANTMILQGADIIDVGGESTRPGAEKVHSDEEWERLRDVLTQFRKDKRITVSVDTYKSSVASKAISAGVRIINDVWGGMKDPEMIPLIASSDCKYIWTYNNETPIFNNVIDDLNQWTERIIIECSKRGMDSDRLWIDPGIGFNKSHVQNMQILAGLQNYCSNFKDYNVVLGTSRKSVIGNILKVPPSDRLEGSLCTVALGVSAGVSVVRVHDVLQTKRTCEMTEAILAYS